MKTITLTLKPVDISPSESKGPIRLGVRNTESRKWNSECFHTVEPNKPTLIEIDDIPDQFPQDSNVWIEMFLKTEEGYIRSGEASISFMELKQGGTFSRDVNCHQLVINDTNPTKANLQIDVEEEEGNKKKKISSNITFKDKYQFIQENKKGIENTLKKNMDQAMKFVNMKMLAEELEGVAAPFDQNNVSAPANMFFIDTTFDDMPIDQSERYFLSNIRCSLRRNKVTEDEFNEAIETLMKKKDFRDIKKNGSMEIYKVCKVISDSMTNVSVSRDYGSDKGYYKGKATVCENFQHAERIQALCPHGRAFVDCEDSACSILINYRGLQKLKKKFTNRTTINASKIANLNVVGACLATVTGSQLSDSNGNPVKIHIGDENEKKLKKGAHMFVLVTPYPHFQKMIPESDQKKFSVSYDVFEKMELASCLPHHILEGTGSLNPNVFPHSSYFGEKLREEAFNMQLDDLKSQVSLMKGQASENILSYGKLQKSNPNLEDEEGLQPVFIRIVSDMFVTQFNEYGDHFVFTSEGKRGAYLRNVCLSDRVGYKYQDEEFYSSTKLMMFKRESAEDKKYISNIFKQTPFSPGNYLTEKSIDARLRQENLTKTSSRENLLIEFNEKSASITSSRKAKCSNSITFFYIKDDFFFEKDGKSLRTPKILADIKNNKNIINAKAKIVFISEYNHVVDLELEMEISQLVYKGKKHQKEVESLMPKSFILEDEHIFNKEEEIIANPFKKVWIKAHTDSDVMDHLSDDMDALLNMTERYASEDPEYLDIEPIRSFYGFRTVVALLKMGHIQRDLMPFLMDKGRKRGVVLPWISVEETYLIPEVLSSGADAHLGILLDHAFYFDRMIQEKVDEFERYPTMNDSPEKRIKKYLILEDEPDIWPQSNARIYLSKVKELSPNSSRVPIVNWLDPKCIQFGSTYGRLLQERKLNISFFATNGLILDQRFLK